MTLTVYKETFKKYILTDFKWFEMDVNTLSNAANSDG